MQNDIKNNLEEKEVKFLDIDVAAMEEKLIALGAKKAFTILYKRKVYDYPDLRLHKQAAWIRLRDEGEKTTLTYKKRIGANTATHGDAGMEEIELVVDDFAKTAVFFEKIGFKEKFYEENKRTRYILHNVYFDIDTWPLLPPYLEIEAETWEEIDKAVVLLGLNPADKKICSTYQVYKMYGYNEDDFAQLTFEKTVKK